MQSSGAKEGSVIVTTRRGRTCVRVLREQRANLLPNSVVLDESNSKSSQFVEPEELSPLNNLKQQLTEVEESLVTEVLRNLTLEFLSLLPEVEDLQKSLTGLDLVCSIIRLC